MTPRLPRCDLTWFAELACAATTLNHLAPRWPRSARVTPYYWTLPVTCGTARLDSLDSLDWGVVHRPLAIVAQVICSRGEEHPDCVWGTFKIAQLYQLQKRFDDAIDTCNIALKRAGTKLTTRHPLYEKIES